MRPFLPDVLTEQDDTRLWRTKTEGQIWKPGENDVSAYFCAVNRNKRSITLNLKHPKARDIVLRLAKGADVVYVSCPWRGILTR